MGNNQISNGYSSFFQCDNTSPVCSLSIIQNNYFPCSPSSNPLFPILLPLHTADNHPSHLIKKKKQLRVLPNLSTNKIPTYPLNTHSLCFCFLMGNPCPISILSPLAFSLHSCSYASLLHSPSLLDHLHCYTNML